MSTQQIVDEGSLHKYRTEVPNIVVRGSRGRGLSIYAKWLYVYCKSVAGDNGHCTKSTTTMVEEVDMSRGQISAARKELVQAQLIRMTTGKRKNRDSLTIHIVDIWLENMQECSVHNTNSSVQDMNTGTVEETSNYQSGVHNTNSGVHNTNSGVHVVDPKKIPIRRRSKEERSSPNGEDSSVSLPEHARKAPQKKPIRKTLAEDDWLAVLLRQQDFVPDLPFTAVDDADWWACLSHLVDTFDAQFMEYVLADMGRYFIQKPLKKPRTNAGWKRIFGTWFKNIGEKQRRNAYANSQRTKQFPLRYR